MPLAIYLHFFSTIRLALAIIIGRSILMKQTPLIDPENIAKIWKCKNHFHIFWVGGVVVPILASHAGGQGFDSHICQS